MLDDAPTTASVEDICVDTRTSFDHSHLPPTYEGNDEAFEQVEIEEPSNEELCFDDVIHSLGVRNIEEMSTQENVATNSQTIPCSQRRTKQIQRNR